MRRLLGLPDVADGGRVLDKMIRDYFTGITLADIAEEGKLWKKKTETN